MHLEDPSHQELQVILVYLFDQPFLGDQVLLSPHVDQQYPVMLIIYNIERIDILEPYINSFISWRSSGALLSIWSIITRYSLLAETLTKLLIITAKSIMRLSVYKYVYQCITHTTGRKQESLINLILNCILKGQNCLNVNFQSLEW